MTGAHREEVFPVPRPADADRDPASAAGPQPVEGVASPADPVESHPAVDRLAALAARLLGLDWTHVALLTEVPTIAAGAGAASGSVRLQSASHRSLCEVTLAGGGEPLVVARAAADARVAHLAPVTSGAVGAVLGVPLVDATGRTLGALCVFDHRPRDWTATDVNLVSVFASAVVAVLAPDRPEAEHDAVRPGLGPAVDAAGMGTFDLDVGSGRISGDARLGELFGDDGWAAEPTLASFTARLHPEDRLRVTMALQKVIETAGEIDLDFRVVHPGAGTRWISTRGRAVRGACGTTTRLLGVAYDTTDRRDSATLVARVLETVPAAFVSMDQSWRISYVNGRAEQLLGRTRSELLGNEVWTLSPEMLGTGFETAYREAVRTGTPVQFEAFYPPPLNTWYDVSAWPGPDGLSVYFHDATQRRRALQQAERARTEAEQAAARIDLLAEVSAAFSAELDAEHAVADLAQLLVPALSDWCLVSVLDDDGVLRDIASWHAQAEMRDTVAEYGRLRLAALTEASYLSQALHSGQPVVVPPPAVESVGALLTGRAQALIERLDPQHGIVVPLLARGRTLGALSLYAGPGRGALNVLDFVTVTEVARRAGMGLDNARMFRRQRNLAEALQRSMLTEPPEPPEGDGLRIAVRYVPAAAEAQVGGDWYDAFRQPDGHTVLSIGDVVGHDTAAAGAMGQVRGLLRGIAYTTGASPAGVLTRLDQAMAGLAVDTSATVVLARLEQEPRGPGGRRTTMRWANAGHPPPMVVRADGTVTVLAGAHPDPLLGIDPSVPRSDHTHPLAPGSTVLLYTDGLIERRTEDLDLGLARLAATLRALAGLPLDDLCDQILARMRPGVPDDDVALVAIRLEG